jgi:hypothetical protein
MAIPDRPLDESAHRSAKRSILRVAGILLRDQHSRGACVVAAIAQYLGQFSIGLRMKPGRDCQPWWMLPYAQTYPFQTAGSIDGSSVKVVIYKAVDRQPSRRGPTRLIVDESLHRRAAKVERSAVPQRVDPTAGSISP